MDQPQDKYLKLQSDDLKQSLHPNGQKKLLELGRAMMSGARTLLLDEPAAGVNRTLLATLRDDLKRLHQEGYTCLVIEHDMDFIGDLCDPIYVMAEGRVLMKGNMQEIRANTQVQEAYLGGAALKAERTA